MLDDAFSGIIDGFVEESERIVDDIMETIEAIESEEKGAEAFGDFAQKVDRIMGCATSLKLFNVKELALALEIIGRMSEGCKTLGYRATLLKQPESVVITAGILADATEMLATCIRDLKKGYVSIDMTQAKAVGERIGWICQKLKLSPEDERKLKQSFGI